MALLAFTVVADFKRGTGNAERKEKTDYWLKKPSNEVVYSSKVYRQDIPLFYKQLKNSNARCVAGGC